MIFNPSVTGGAGTELVTLDLTNDGGFPIRGFSSGELERFCSPSDDPYDYRVDSLSVPKGSLVFIYSTYSYANPRLSGDVTYLFGGSNNGLSDMQNWSLYRVNGNTSLFIYASS